MGSSVTTRPNHYEVLGLKPTASDKEIAAAFAREIGRPRAFGGLTQLSIAYEVLRDPAKRRAYDDSIGVKPEPLPRAARPSIVQFSGSAHFIGAAIAGPGGLRDHGRPPHLEPLREPEPVAPLAAVPSEPEPMVEPEIASANRALPGFEPDRALGYSDGQIQWKRPVVILGTLVGTAGLIGAWVGSVAGSDAQADPAERAVTVALPKAKQAPRMEQAAATEWVAAEVQPERSRTNSAAVRRIRSAPVQQPRALSAQELEELAPVEIARPANAFVEQATAQVAEVAPVQAAAADMPLSNATIARTIHRIGYSCGQVASTSAVEGGAPGVFTVTCSSGATYRASPVRGRYRFKRVSGQ
jgi:hypothetical protein